MTCREKKGGDWKHDGSKKHNGTDGHGKDWDHGEDDDKDKDGKHWDDGKDRKGRSCKSRLFLRKGEAKPFGTSRLRLVTAYE